MDRVWTEVKDEIMDRVDHSKKLSDILSGLHERLEDNSMLPRAAAKVLVTEFLLHCAESKE